MVTALLASNLVAEKLFVLGPFTFTAGIIVFPLTYILGDVLTEVYGYARARRVIWMGFGANLFLAVTVAVAVALPPSPDWSGQRDFETLIEQLRDEHGFTIEERTGNNARRPVAASDTTQPSTAGTA